MKKLLLALGTLVALAACSSDDDPANDFVPQSCERTVIVYMSGENSLTGYVNTNLKQMKEGSRQLSPSSCLLAFVDKSKVSELPWLARIRDSQVTDSVSLADMGISQKDEYASDPQVMEDVLKYAVSHYPATRDYGLVLWGHSTGWLMADSIAYTRAYGVDNGINSSVSNEGKCMNVPTLARVLVVYKTFAAQWRTDKKWDTFYGNNFTPTPERQSGVSMYIAQSPFAGNHVTYQRDIQKLAWYYAAGYSAVGW